jgi:replication factor C subunit 3/5
MKDNKTIYINTNSNIDMDMDIDMDSDIDSNYSIDSIASINSVIFNKKDFLPWSEYHRPPSIDKIISHSKIKYSLNEYLKLNEFPHLMFYGPPGTGKTSIIRAFAKQFYGECYDFMVMEINASEHRGIDIVREDIKNFVSSKSNFKHIEIDKFKLVILDEADNLTPDTQGILRYTIEKYTKIARFCIICNDKSKIIPAIESRTTTMKFKPLGNDDVKVAINEILKFRNIKMDDNTINMLIKISNGDLRFLLNKLQALTMQLNDENIIITTDMVAQSCGYPTDNDINMIIKILFDDVSNKDINKKVECFKKYITSRNIEMASIIIELSIYMYQKIIVDKEVKSVYKKLFNLIANMESSFCNVTNNDIHYRTLISSIM